MPNHVTTRCTVSGPRVPIATTRSRAAMAAAVAEFVATCIRPDNPEPAADANQQAGWAQSGFDFTTIIPMPAVVAATQSGSDADLGIEILTGKPRLRFLGLGADSYLSYPWIQELGITDIAGLRAWADKERPESIPCGQLALAAFQETGFYDWYDWSIANWGTKWNAYEFSAPPYAGEDTYEFSFNTAWSFPQPVFDKLATMFPRLVFSCACFDEGWGFAGEGCFNGQPAFAVGEATAALYERVYGHSPSGAELEMLEGTEAEDEV